MGLGHVLGDGVWRGQQTQLRSLYSTHMHKAFSSPRPTTLSYQRQTRAQKSAYMKEVIQEEFEALVDGVVSG